MTPEELVSLIISNTASQYSEEWKPDKVYSKDELIEIAKGVTSQPTTKQSKGQSAEGMLKYFKESLNPRYGNDTLYWDSIMDTIESYAAATTNVPTEDRSEVHYLDLLDYKRFREIQNMSLKMDRKGFSEYLRDNWCIMKVIDLSGSEPKDKEAKRSMPMTSSICPECLESNCVCA